MFQALQLPAKLSTSLIILALSASIALPAFCQAEANSSPASAVESKDEHQKAPDSTLPAGKKQDVKRVEGGSVDVDPDQLFGGVSFLKGVGDTKKADGEGEIAADEIVGRVEETTNPYTSIPKPSGIIVGTVYEPSKDGKEDKSGATSVLTGLQMLMNAMNAGGD